MSDQEHTFEGRPIRFLPTRSHVERAWVMLQAQLDEEAGRETDALLYSREFRAWYKSEAEAFSQGKQLLTTVAELDSLPAHSIIRDDNGEGYVFVREEAPYHWAGVGEVGYTTSELGIKLPAQLIYRAS